MESNHREQHENEDREHGVLLYYKYAQIPDLDSLFAFYDSNCKSLHLLGRVRLSPLGVNVTVLSLSLFVYVYMYVCVCVPLYMCVSFTSSMSFW